MIDRPYDEIHRMTGGKKWQEGKMAIEIYRQILKLKYFCNQCTKEQPNNLNIIQPLRLFINNWEVSLFDLSGWKSLDPKLRDRQVILVEEKMTKVLTEKTDDLFQIAKISCQNLLEFMLSIEEQEVTEALIWIDQLKTSQGRDDRIRKLTDQG
jgi:hypothetical protein